MRYFVFLLAVTVMVSMLVVPAYASDGGDGGGVLDVLWDIFSSIGDFFSGIFDALWDGLKWLLEGIKALFIPRTGFFRNAFNDLKGALNNKMGGIMGLGSYLSNRFQSLRASRNVDFALEFPSGHLLDGQRLNLLGEFLDVFAFVRGAFSGFIILLTFAFCYRRVTGMINS